MSGSLTKWTGDLAAGFSRERITDGWKHPRAGATFPEFAVHDDLWATAFVVTHKARPVFAFVSLDLGTVQRHTAAELREIVARKTGIDASAILLHATHTHAAYAVDKVDPEWFAARLSAAIEAAAQSALPATVFHGMIDLGAGYNFNRRIRLSDDLGAHCVMFNTDCRTEGGRVEASGQIEKTVRDWEADWSALSMSRREIWCDGPIDARLHVVRFRDDAGKRLGTIVRFAGHPVIVSRFWIGNTLSRDAVGYAVDYLHDLTGAPCLYVTGPSGNLRLYCEEYSHAEAQKRGRLIAANEKLTFPEKMSEFDRFAFAWDEPSPALWPGFPRDAAEQKAKLDALTVRVRAAVAAKRPPAEIKRLADEHQRMKFAAQMLDRAMLSPEEAAAGRAPAFVGAFDLGPCAVATFPCEPFLEVSAGVRAAEGDNVLTAQLVNGSHGYVPTAEENALGGYESTWRTLADDGADVLIATASRLVRAVRE